MWKEKLFWILSSNDVLKKLFIIFMNFYYLKKLYTVIRFSSMKKLR